MPKNYKRKTKNNLSRTSSNPYNSNFIQQAIKNVLAGLKILSMYTFDPGLYAWTKGLEQHLKKKLEEAEREKREIEKYRF